MITKTRNTLFFYGVMAIGLISLTFLLKEISVGSGVIKKLNAMYLEKALFFNTLFATIPIILIIEKIIPVDPKQKTFEAGFLQDMIWLFLNKGFQITVIVWYAGVLASFYQKYLSYLTISGVMNLPFWLRALIGILLSDFLNWVHHFIKHKVPLFWHFHAVHHSQEKMNLFTDFRIHPGEFFISKTIFMFSFFILDFEPLQVVLFTVFSMFLTRFYHSNIKTNLGPLRYILVTPQSHRIHHSLASEHKDKNFGVVFSIWDRIFRTLYTGYDEFPTTGIQDKSFPHEKGCSPIELAKSTLQQLAYPFFALTKPK